MVKIIKVWVVYDTVQKLEFVDYRYTRKDMKQHHCDTLGLMSWKEAAAKGHVCIKATLKIQIPKKHG